MQKNQFLTQNFVENWLWRYLCKQLLAGRAKETMPKLSSSKRKDKTELCQQAKICDFSQKYFSKRFKYFAAESFLFLFYFGSFCQKFMFSNFA